jgi:steroid delta-isomerase-like uncharacterized protein
MSAKDVVRAFYAAVDAGDTAAADSLFATDWENVDPALPPMRGIEGGRALLGMFTSAFPDFRSEIQLIAEQDGKVAVRASHTGTHQGPFMGIPATGRQAAVSATGIFTVRDGKLVQNRVVFNAFGLLQQLGVIPAA